MKLKVILTHCTAYKARRFNPYKRPRPRLLPRRTADVDHDLPQSDIGLEKCCSSGKDMMFVNSNTEGTQTLYPLEKGFSKADQSSLGDDLATKLSDSLVGGNTEDDCVIIGYYPAGSDTPSDLQDKDIGNSQHKVKDIGNSQHKDKDVDPTLLLGSEKKDSSSVSDGEAADIAGKEGPSREPRCDTLDFLFTHSEVDESNKKYRTWSELETSEGKTNSPPPRESYIPTDQAWWYAQNVIAIGSQLTRLVNESETRRMVPTEEYPTHVCEWLAGVDFRHECVRQKIDYTRPRPKSPREKPGFCARHRPYVRKTRNHREALANVGRVDLNRVQFINNF
ncbi:uncharacterized protein LOC134231504 [Saccostrea cucullata]|uniref:uncharacterized protein LOC134231504 n=1 Tax=Saccostrea cuccullata TaxID=36930 RepID=UPI002ED2D3A3